MARPFVLELLKSGTKGAGFWRCRRGKKVLTSEVYARVVDARKELIKFGEYHGYTAYTDFTRVDSRTGEYGAIVGIPAMSLRKRFQIRAKQFEQAIRDLGGTASPGERDLMHMVRFFGGDSRQVNR